MLKVGITAELGAGKTFISELFRDKDVPYYNCDDNSKKLLITIPELIQKVKVEFGETIYEGNIYKNLANLVFLKDDDTKLTKLVSIIDPFIKEDIDKFYETNKDSKWVLIESATLYEVGMEKTLDRIIYVSVPEEIRFQRAFQRSGLTKEDYVNRMKKQIDPITKIKKSDYIISNYSDFDISQMIEQIWNHLTNCDSEKYVIRSLNFFSK
jgi:dephospho-CoA kinase